MDQFGDNLYNLYGSTEVAYASVADPTDLREAPSSAGRPPYATVVQDPRRAGPPVPDGEPGRIFVGNKMLFEGYTGGGHKEVVDGLMSSGDVGRFGPDGRLYVEGRDDEMIVSGGRERLPGRGRGLPGPPRARSSRRPRSGSTTTTTASGCARSSWCADGDQPVPSEDELQATGSSRTSPATRCRASSSSSTSCRATPRARSSSASWPERPSQGRLMTGIEIGGPAPDFTLRDQFGQDVTLSSFRGTQGGAARLLPLRVLQRLHRRDVADPVAARRVHVLRLRDPGDLLRPDPRAAGLRRQPTASTSRCCRTSGRTGR